MSYGRTSAVLALGAGFALIGCAADVDDTLVDPDGLSPASTESEGSESDDETEVLGQTSQAVRGGGRGHHGGGGRGHHGGGRGRGHHGRGHGGGGGHWGGGHDHGGGGYHGGWTGRGGGGYRGGWGRPGGHYGGGGYYSRLERGHWGYGRGGVIVVGTPVYYGVPQAYYGWIRHIELETRCREIGWAAPECSFVTDYAVCIPDLGCFVRPY